jgi:hypothetical protein
MSTADGREIYVIGKVRHGNREKIIIEDGKEHDLPAGAEYTYSDQVTRFPYETD